MKHRRAVGSVTLLIVALLTREAAADATTIVRVRSTDAALDERLAAELTTLGFTVEDVDEGDGDRDLGAIARAHHAVGAVRAGDHDARDPATAIELWALARSPSDTPIHEIVRIDARRGRSVAVVLALEALRAHLLAVRPEPAPTPPPIAAPPPPAEPVALSPPSVPWLWLHLAFGADASPGGLGPAAEVFVEVRVEPRAWVALSMFGAFSPTTAHVDAPEGGATAHHGIAGGVADAQARLGPATVSLGAGGALVLLALRGTNPAASYAERDASSLTAGPILRSCLALPIAPALRVRAELTFGLTFPRATISFAAREVADWGRPFALLTLGIEWGALRAIAK